MALIVILKQKGVIMANEDKKISTKEILETLNKNLVVSEREKKELEFARMANNIIEEQNQISKKKKLIFGIVLGAVLMLFLILALALPNAGQTSKLFFN